MKERVQQKHRQRQLLFLLGGRECVTGMARRGRGGRPAPATLPAGTSDLAAVVGISGAVAVCCGGGASTSVSTGWILWLCSAMIDDEIF